MNTLASVLPELSARSKNILGVAVASGFGLAVLKTLTSRGPARKPKRLPSRNLLKTSPSSFPDLKEAFDLDPSLLGNKAFHLTSLKSLGYNVPNAVVILSPAYERHIQRSNCSELISQLANPDLEESQMDNICRTIRERITNTEGSLDLLQETDRFLAKLTGPLGVAVRSSSNQEDSAGKAFAGQFETHLNVPKTATDVIDKVKRVWASLWTTHVIIYRRKMSRQNNQSGSPVPAMAVIIQEMVDSAASGVVFTVNPFGLLTTAMIESYFGQGEALVSGEISPDQFVIDKQSRKIVKKTINLHKKSASYVNREGGLVSSDLPASLAAASSLTEAQVISLVKLALEIEEELGVAQDIEFAVDKQGKIFLLQARPVTTQSKKYSFLQEWKPPGPGAWVKENVHCPNVMTRIVGPLTAVNLTAGTKESSAKICCPLDCLESKFVNGFSYTVPRLVGAPPSANGAPPKLIFSLLMKLHPTIRKRLGGLDNMFKEKPWRKDMDFWLREDRANCIHRNTTLSAVDITTLSDSELLAHYIKCHDNVGYMIFRHHTYTFTATFAIGDFLAHLKDWGIDVMDGMQLFRCSSPVSCGVETFMVDDILKAFSSDADAVSLLRTPSNDPAAVIERLKQRSEPVREAIKKYSLFAGSRPAVGYDIDQATIAEVPQLFLDGLRKTYEYGAKLLTLPAVTTEEVNALRNRVPEKDRALFDELYEDAAYLHPLRDERGLYCDTMSVGPLRRAVLEIGKRLALKKILPNAELALCASDPELRAMMTRPDDDHSAVVSMLQEWDEYRTTDPCTVPDTLGGIPAPPPPAEWFPKHAVRMMKAVQVILPMVNGLRPNNMEQVVEEKKLYGYSGSRGVVEGRVRVVKSLEHDAAKFEKGDILVAYCTSASFCLLLSQSAAVITEEGGALSHAAITARELHIPAVVAAKNALQVLHDGMRVRVDGNTGEVFIL